MKLKKVIIKNYRCYKNETILNIDNLSCIIGQNDIGKSSILEAINAFFYDSIDASDVCTEGDDKKVSITCIFDDLPKELVLDSTIPSDLEEEGLLNIDNDLEIERLFDFSGKTVSKSTYVNCYYYSSPELIDLLKLKNPALKAFAQEKDVDLSHIDKKVNREIRAKIREAFPSEKTITQIKVDGNLTSEDNIKAIWKKISDQLPTFALFKMDKVLSDKDENVQDPLKLAIDEALKVEDIQQKLHEIEEFVKEKTTEVADSTIKKMENFDKKLAESLRSSFSKLPRWSSVFDITLLNEKNIPLNKRGSGIRRLVLLSFFQAQAEKRQQEKNSPSIIYAIEEPETSQHPNHQLEIVHSLVELSQASNTQVLFTSHSANLVREMPLPSIKFVSAQNGEIIIEDGINEDGSSNNTVLSKVISTLGILPNPADLVKLLLFVEGINDVNALKGYSKILFEGGKISEDIMAQEEKLGIVITGGSSLKYYVQNNYLGNLGKPQLHIYDNDKEEYRKLVSKINGENNPQKKAYNTTKVEMENFLCKDAIEEAYQDINSPISISTEISDDTDVPNLICHLRYLDFDAKTDEEKHKKESSVKRFLNTAAVNKMSIDRLIHRAALNELVAWFEQMITFKNI
jgi:predicted ATP-dependent endonuclease of OLD family